MTTETEFLNDRRRSDDRMSLVRALDPDVAPRLSPALVAIRRLLVDAGGWVPWPTAMAEGLRASDVTFKSVDNLLHKAAGCGLLERRGAYDRRTRTDGREIRIADWPTGV